MKKSTYTISLAVFVLLFSILASPAAWIITFENADGEKQTPEIFETKAEMVTRDLELKEMEELGVVKTVTIYEGNRVSVTYELEETNNPTGTGVFAYFISYRVPIDENTAWQYECYHTSKDDAEAKLAEVRKKKEEGLGWSITPGFEQPIYAEVMNSNRVLIVTATIVEN